MPSPSIPVTEAQWGTIEPHLPRGSLQAGGARVSNPDLRRGDPPVLTTGARRRDSLRRMSPLIDLLTAPGLGRGCDPLRWWRAFLDHAQRPRPAPVREHVHGWLDCLGKKGPPTSV